MRRAIAAARAALLAGQAPIGACIVLDGEILAAVHNGVVAGPDATAHAEVLVIRAACRTLRSTRLDGAVLCATVEPCPMCLAACHYAGIREVHFGAPLTALMAITGTELVLPAPPGIAMHGGVLGTQCTALLTDWARSR
jgi:tRNA(Arg) A34 adenosine deaminase TadA